MKTRIVRIGSSRGVRLPKTLLAKARLTDEVEIVARNGTIVISSAMHPRSGWSEAAKRARTRGDDRLLNTPTATSFDDEEWKW